jgi:hypothetical protein
MMPNLFLPTLKIDLTSDGSLTEEQMDSVIR